MDKAAGGERWTCVARPGCITRRRYTGNERPETLFPSLFLSPCWYLAGDVFPVRADLSPSHLLPTAAHSHLQVLVLSHPQYLLPETGRMQWVWLWTYLEHKQLTWFQDGCHKKQRPFTATLPTVSLMEIFLLGWITPLVNSLHSTSYPPPIIYQKYHRNCSRRQTKIVDTEEQPKHSLLYTQKVASHSDYCADYYFQTTQKKTDVLWDHKANRSKSHKSIWWKSIAKQSNSMPTGILFWNIEFGVFQFVLIPVAGFVVLPLLASTLFSKTKIFLSSPQGQNGTRLRKAKSVTFKFSCQMCLKIQEGCGWRKITFLFWNCFLCDVHAWQLQLRSLFQNPQHRKHSQNWCGKQPHQLQGCDKRK